MFTSAIIAETKVRIAELLPTAQKSVKELTKNVTLAALLKEIEKGYDNARGGDQSKRQGLVTSLEAAGPPLTVYGRGGQTRGFLDIRNTVRRIEIACAKHSNLIDLGSQPHYLSDSLLDSLMNTVIRDQNHIDATLFLLSGPVEECPISAPASRCGHGRVRTGVLMPGGC